MSLRNKLREQRTAVESLWKRYQSSETPQELRPEIVDSWDRSKSKVNLSVAAAPGTDENIKSIWADSPLFDPVVQLESSLSGLAEEGGFIVAVTDPESRILWTTGSSHMKNKAAKANFAPGGMWDEESVGTNALDLAMRTQKEQTVFSAEHFAPLVHGWVCYAAPIFDTKQNSCLGVIDISTTWDNANPLALMAVTSFAELLSSEVSAQLALPNKLRIKVLGTSRVESGFGVLNLPRRQVEILFILSLYPQGLSLEELHTALYGDQVVSLSTLKAELSHLRQAIGGGIESRPYRLTIDIETDYQICLRELKVGKFDRAMVAFSGDLLHSSTSPVIEERRSLLMAALHSAALQSDSVDSMIEYLEHVPHDLAVCEHLAAIIRTSDPRYAICQAHLNQAQRL